MKALGNQVPWVLAAAAIALLIGWTSGNAHGQKGAAELLLELGQARDDIEVVRNEKASLEDALVAYQGENQDLLDTIATLQERPAEIKYIVRTETVVKPVETVQVLKEIPPTYLFEWENGLVVAEFQAYEEDYAFITYPVEFETTTVVGDDKTAVLFQATSEYDPDFTATLLTETQVQKIQPRKKWETHIGVGVTGGYPNPDLRANIFGSFYHPLETLDVGVLRLSANKNNFAVGVDPVAYNIGEPLPVLTDTWLSAGVDVDIDGNVQGTISLGSKF